MPDMIQRTSQVPGFTVQFGTTLENSTPIAMSVWSALAIYVAPGVTSTTLTWYASYSSTGPWGMVVLPGGTAASTTVVADRVFISPPELFPCHYLKGVAGTAFQAVAMTKG